MSQVLFVIIKNREKSLYMGEAAAISSQNDRGPFDILPMHANLITLIKDKIWLKKVGGEYLEFPVTGQSVLWCTANKVEVFLGI